MMRYPLLIAGVVGIFAAQAVASAVLHRAPFLPSPPPLANIAPEVGGMSQVAEETIDPSVVDVLGPDDILARLYQLPGEGGQAELFVAYYKSQLREKQAHDPKVCLPGSGWNPIDSHLAWVPLPGSAKSFPVNYYRIKKEESEEVVLYWFQTPKGIYTFEQQLRFHRIVDAITDNRTDMALVRIVVPVTRTDGLAGANASAIRLAQAAYTQMVPYFPPTASRAS